MLINFSVENWRSYRDRATFSMIASRERQHRERLPFLKKYKTNVLPIAVIYGGNASGKTNFFKALNFVKKLVVVGTQPENLIPREPFLLNPEYIGKPSYFSVEILAKETIYGFSFLANNQTIIEEKLVEINKSTESEKILYHRKDNQPNFDEKLPDPNFLNFAFKGTRDNQLFLTNSVSQNIDTFRPVYNWFRSTLELIAPDSRFNNFEHFLNEDHPLYATMNKELPSLDTGIAKLEEEIIPFENVQLPPSIKDHMQENLKEGMTFKLPASGYPIVITRKAGELIAKRLVTYHKSSDGSNIKFEIAQESDGSQRIIDLLPAFLEMALADSKKVYIIDELDRSLHAHLTRNLISRYLSNCDPESRSQLLFTTHDSLLMDQELFRRDEMWITERDSENSSKLYSFSEFKDVRYDKNLQKSYLQGRMGGVPFLQKA